MFHLVQLTKMNQIPSYLKSLKLSNDEFEKLIIGTMGTLDSPRSEDQKGFTAYNRYRTKVTQEDIQTVRDQILAAKLSDIIDLSEMTQDFVDKGAICVIGSQPAIDKNKAIFNQVNPIFKSK